MWRKKDFIGVNPFNEAYFTKFYVGTGKKFKKPELLSIHGMLLVVEVLTTIHILRIQGKLSIKVQFLSSIIQF